MSILELVICILVIAWFTGTTIFPVGSLIHLLLVIAVVLLIVRLLQMPRL